MHHVYICLYSIAIFISLSLCCAEEPFGPKLLEADHTIEQAPELTDIINGNTQFAFRFYQRLINKKGNLFFSPYSISSAFIMTVAGAKGETAIEMQNVLQYPIGIFPLLGDLNHQLFSPSDDIRSAPQLLLANAIWVQRGLSLLPAFQKAVGQIGKAFLETVNFQQEPVNALRMINQWVSQQTNGKISQLINPQDITPNTRMVLTSAIYMRGRWAQIFDPKQTIKAPFYIQNHHAIQTPMMKITGNYPLFVHQQFAMLEIPYLNKSEKGPQLSMVIILPTQYVGLETLENQLTIDHWNNWLGQMKMTLVHLVFPKFRIQDRLELNPIMQELGMNQPFSPQADFSGMTGRKELYINKAIHKTYIRVDEEGTEAAAATGIGMNVTSVPQLEKPYQFIADHPFLFFIIDTNTKSILFIGRLMQP